MALTDKLKAIADAIRAKIGGTDTMTLDDMPTAISNISGDVEPPYVKETYDASGNLIADEGMTLTNGEVVASCIDVDSIDGWSEIADETEEVVEESK